MSNDEMSNEELSWSLEDQGYVYRRSTKQYHATGSGEEADNNLSFEAIEYVKSHGQVSKERAVEYLEWLNQAGRQHTEE